MNKYHFVAATVLASIGLGIAIDLVTANVAVEYFSVHHPKIINSVNPWLLALAWGFAASWWFGLVAAVLVCIFNERQHRPMDYRTLFRWVSRGLVAIWVAMMCALGSVYALASLVPINQRRPSYEHDRRLIAVAMAHQFEYLLGAVVVLVLLVKIWKVSRRESLARDSQGRNQSP